MLCFLPGFRRYLLQIIRQQVANIENTCHKAGGEKVKAVQNTKKQCQLLFPGTQADHVRKLSALSPSGFFDAGPDPGAKGTDRI